MRHHGGAPVSVIIAIDDSVPVVQLAQALASAGLAIRHDRSTNRLVIRAAARMTARAPELAKLLNSIAATRPQ